MFVRARLDSPIWPSWVRNDHNCLLYGLLGLPHRIEQYMALLMELRALNVLRSLSELQCLLLQPPFATSHVRCDEVVLKAPGVYCFRLYA